jgi:hypothetical protein
MTFHEAHTERPQRSRTPHAPGPRREMLMGADVFAPQAADALRSPPSRSARIAATAGSAPMIGASTM